METYCVVLTDGIGFEESSYFAPQSCGDEKEAVDVSYFQDTLLGAFWRIFATSMLMHYSLSDWCNRLMVT